MAAESMTTEEPVTAEEPVTVEEPKVKPEGVPEPTVVYESQWQDYAYAVYSDNTVCITDYEGTDENVDIPAQIEDMPVTSIGEYAFEYCDKLTIVCSADSYAAGYAEAQGIPYKEA